MIEYIEPTDMDGKDYVVIEVSDADAIAQMRKLALERGFSYISDRVALDDFIAIHWAKYVPSEVQV